MRNSKKISKEKLEFIIDNIAWDKSPLIPTIAQDSATKEVLMLAYSDKDSLAISLKTGLAHYFSRSKNRIWQKGEESGNTQKINEIYIDCDNDSILFMVNQSGSACHTGHISCFFKTIANLDFQSTQTGKIAPYHILDTLYHILQERKFAPSDKSYTASLYEKGANAICKKIIEESSETTFAIKDFLKNKSDSAVKDFMLDSAKIARNAVIYESADLVFHLLVGLSYCNISPDEVMSELRLRFGISGIDEKNARK